MNIPIACYDRHLACNHSKTWPAGYPCFRVFCTLTRQPSSWDSGKNYTTGSILSCNCRCKFSACIYTHHSHSTKSTTNTCSQCSLHECA